MAVATPPRMTGGDDRAFTPRASTLDRMLEEDEQHPISLAPQHWRARATGPALCGSYSFAASSRHGVTCEVCKRLAAQRDARLAKPRDGRARKQGAA